MIQEALFLKIVQLYVDVVHIHFAHLKCTTQQFLKYTVHIQPSPQPREKTKQKREKWGQQNGSVVKGLMT